MTNPYAPPPSPRAQTSSRSMDYGGFRRRYYFLASLGIVGIQELTGASFEEPLSFLLFFLLPILYITSLRLRNIGVTPWFTVMAFVPVIHFAVALACSAMPEGYAETRELDTAGTVIAVLFLLCLFSILAVLLLMGKLGYVPPIINP